MLTQLRDFSQSWLIKGLLIVICVTFVISFGAVNFVNRKEVLVQVDGEEILVGTFLTEYEQRMDRLRQQYPDNADALAQQLNLREQVMTNIVNRTLMLRAAEAEGLRVTDEDLAREITGNPVFQIEGRFDQPTYIAVLRQNNLTPEGYEDSLRQDLLLQKYQRNVLNGVVVSDLEVEQRFLVEHQRAVVDYVFVDPDQFKLKQAPDEAALRTYYEANPRAFTQPDQFKLRYFTLGLPNLEDRVDVRDRAVERYYERNADTEFTTAKRVRASHILMKVDPEASADQQDEVRKKLAEVEKQAKAGADFAKLAKQFSQDATASNGGDLGFFRLEEMVPSVAEAAFSLDVGQVSGVVRSPFGFHIIKTTAIEPAVKKTLDEVRDQISEKLSGQRAERSLNIEKERLPDRMAQQGIEAVAEDFGRDLQETPLFDGTAELPGLGPAAALYNQVKSRRVNSFGVWERNPLQGHVFYEIVEKKDSYVKPFEEVREQALLLTEAEMRRDLALEAAKAVAPGLDSEKKLSEFARKNNLQIKSASFTSSDVVIEGLGVNRDLQRKAFALTPDAPFGLAISNMRAYLVHLKNFELPDGDEAQQDKEALADALQGEWQQYVMNREIERLRGESEIVLVSPAYVSSGN